jgi:hypothetical protein
MQSCKQQERGKTPPDESKAQPETILDDLEERLLPPVTPDIKAWLGDTVLALLTTAETISSYQIVPKKDLSQEQEHLLGYPIVQRGQDLTPGQRIRFQGLLVDQQSYRPESIKKCLFLPEYAFILHKGDAELTVLLSPSCAQIQVLAGENTWLRDCDPALPKFQKLVEDLFPESAAGSKKVTPHTVRNQEISVTMTELLTDSVVKSVAAPDSVIPYQIFPKQQAADSNLHGYPVLKQAPALAPEHVAEFQSVVLSDASYRFDTVKKCLFLPEYAMLVVCGDTEVTLLCDVNCGQVTFLTGSQSIVTNWQDQGFARLHTLMTNVLVTP